MNRRISLMVFRGTLLFLAFLCGCGDDRGTDPSAGNCDLEGEKLKIFSPKSGSTFQIGDVVKVRYAYDGASISSLNLFLNELVAPLNTIIPSSLSGNSGCNEYEWIVGQTPDVTDYSAGGPYNLILASYTDFDIKYVVENITVDP